MVARQSGLDDAKPNVSDTAAKSNLATGLARSKNIRYFYRQKNSMGETKKKRRTSCAVEVGADVLEIAGAINAQRSAEKKPKYSIVVIVEAMVDVGKIGDWQPVAEQLFQEKRQNQTGRGRPRKE